MNLITLIIRSAGKFGEVTYRDVLLGGQNYGDLLRGKSRVEMR